ncbi:chromosome partitioning protein [Thermosulfuriphilus ammonigenes]|uniref:ParA family protein n=1 Tax=Thermosulfuriphilus ammonigenes TaxID=1936021 RepID=UPI00184AC6F7|nr:AAA family ATPase [Thermosulfuriphilus ammonigenes]MBA2847870.1 chromosome partitioning protein [Thermosulfuriphilus ammonigenes]
MEHVRIFAIANQKGGVGKTTTAINLAAGVAILGKRVLLIDSDPQANATSGLGAEVAEGHLYHLLLGEIQAQELLRETEVPGLLLLPAQIDLIGVEAELLGFKGRERCLAQGLFPLAERFDYCFIDCPPSLGLLTINALSAAHGVIIPLQCEYYALEGLGLLVQTIRRVKQSLNPRLFIQGLVLTMYDKRNRLTHQVRREVTNHFGQLVYQTVIPRNVRLSEAPSHGKPIFLYDVHSRGAMAYMELAKEFLKREMIRREKKKSAGKRS